LHGEAYSGSGRSQHGPRLVAAPDQDPEGSQNQRCAVARTVADGAKDLTDSIAWLSSSRPACASSAGTSLWICARRVTRGFLPLVWLTGSLKNWPKPVQADVPYAVARNDRAFARWDSRVGAQDVRVSPGRHPCRLPKPHLSWGSALQGLHCKELAADFAAGSPLALGRTARADAGASGSLSFPTATDPRTCLSLWRTSTSQSTCRRSERPVARSKASYRPSLLGFVPSCQSHGSLVSRRKRTIAGG
jgi:hypothetical protein